MDYHVPAGIDTKAAGQVRENLPQEEAQLHDRIVVVSERLRGDEWVIRGITRHHERRVDNFIQQLDHWSPQVDSDLLDTAGAGSQSDDTGLAREEEDEGLTRRLVLDDLNRLVHLAMTHTGKDHGSAVY